MRGRWLVLRLMPLALLTIAGTVSLADADELSPWRQGVVQPKGDAGLIYMATEGGFTRAQGLDAKIVPLNNDVLMLKAVLSGDIDSFEGSPTGPLIAASKGADVKILGCTWPKLTYSVFTHKPYRSLADLAGKSVGISAAGSLPDIVAHAMLRKVGVATDSVKFVVAGSDPERVRAVVAEVVDAAVAASDFAARPELGLTVLGRARDYVPDFVRMCIVTSGETLRKRPKQVAALLAAEMQGYGYALAHRDETIALARRIANLKETDPTPGAIFDEAVEYQTVSPTLEIDVAKFVWLRDLLAQEGSLNPAFDPSTAIDTSFRERALERLAGHLN